jgi:hypothetical protein
MVKKYKVSAKILFFDELSFFWGQFHGKARQKVKKEPPCISHGGCSVTSGHV